jgi:tetratricopeptide (TPR) repeat protein
MKKFIAIFLVSLIFLVFILGCLLDPGDYSKERNLWLIERDFQTLSTHEDSAPAYASERIIQRYDRFIKMSPDSPLAPQAALLKGNVYLFRKNFTKAREIFKDIVDKYSYNSEVVAQAMVLTARSFEQEQKWGNAKSIYDKIIKSYPVTKAGFGVPAYLGYRYLSQGLTQEADQAFEDAVMFYQNVANYYPNSPLEYTAMRMVSECRIAQKRWKDALETTRAWMFKYPSNIMLFEAIKTINDVCIGQLKEYDCAIDTYKQFIIQNPEHPIRPSLQKIITNLENVKNKNSLYR